jgi:PPOX class probable F420-dependent enzyme
MPNDLDKARYVSFTSSKRDGAPVSTPVWLVPFEDDYAFITDANSFKVRRIRNNPKVTLRVSNVRGRVRPDATVHQGIAAVLANEQLIGVEALMRKKYPVGWLLAIQIGDAVRRLRRTRASDDVVVKVVLSTWKRFWEESRVKLVPTSKIREPSKKEVRMGDKIEEAFVRLRNEAAHHTKLAQARDDVYESGFAQGFAEALRIVAEIRG